MDLFNNVVGHTVGSNTSIFVYNQKLSNTIFNILSSDGLVYLSPINYNDPDFWDDPSTPEPLDGNHGITTSTQLIPTNQ